MTPGMSVSERQRMAEERQKKIIADNAKQQSEVLRNIEHERVEQKAQTKLLFCLWYMMDKKLEELEKIRDTNAPKTPDEPWNEQFCTAVEKIPEVKRLCNDLWFAYTNNDRPEYENYV